MPNVSKAGKKKSQYDLILVAKPRNYESKQPFFSAMVPALYFCQWVGQDGTDSWVLLIPDSKREG